MRYLIVVLAVALGVAGFVYGERDDSPGLQGLSLLLVAGAVFYAVRSMRQARHR